MTTTTADDRDRYRDLDLVGVRDIADRLDVTIHAVSMWHRGVRGADDPLPDPWWEVSGVPIWPWWVVEGWARRTGRLPPLPHD